MEEKVNRENKKKERTRKLTMLLCVIVGIVVAYSFVYQGVKQSYLAYEINGLNTKIKELTIENRELSLENVKLQTNENVEKIATEKLGMVYQNKDKVVVVKEQTADVKQSSETEKVKMKIFVQSVFSEINNGIKNFNFKDFTSQFKK